MKLRILLLTAVFALISPFAHAQALSTAAAAAFANAGSDLAKIAAVATAYPGEAAAIARLATKANPANAAQIAATVAKAVPSQSTNIVSEVVKETPTPESAGTIVGSVVAAIGATSSSNLGTVRNIASAAISALPAEVKTPGNLKTFVEIVKSTGAPESAARMGAYDGSGVGIVTISRATPDATKVAAGTAAITAAVNAANLAITNMVPLPGTGGTPAGKINEKQERIPENKTPPTEVDPSTRSAS